MERPGHQNLYISSEYGNGFIEVLGEDFPYSIFSQVNTKTNRP